MSKIVSKKTFIVLPVFQILLYRDLFHQAQWGVIDGDAVCILDFEFKE